MSKTSKKHSFHTLRKDTSALWSKRYRIAFGIAITIIVLMVTGAFIRGRLKDTTNDIVDQSIDKLLGLFGKKATKGREGNYVVTDDGVKDARIDEITKGIKDSLVNVSAKTMDDLTTKLSDFADKSTDLDSDGKPKDPRLKMIVDKIASVPTTKLEELWKKLKDNTTGNNKEEFETTLNSFFKIVKETSMPLENTVYNLSAKVAAGFRSGMPFGGGSPDTSNDFLKDTKFTELQKQAIFILDKKITHFNGKLSFLFMGPSDKEYNEFVDALNDLRKNNLRIQLMDTLTPNAKLYIYDNTSPPNSVTIDGMKKLIEYAIDNKKTDFLPLSTVSFGKKINKKKRSNKKRSNKKRSNKKNKKY